MFEEPLFQSNILPTAGKYLSYYFGFNNWFWQYLAAMGVLYLLYKLLLYKNQLAYPHFFPPEKHKFSPASTQDLSGLAFLAVCLVVYALGLYTQEMSFFANYDTMGPNSMRIFTQGITPFWGVNGRCSPVAFWDVNLIYALTHNFYVINTYILLQIIVILLLLNSLLCFIPAGKRFCIIGLVIVSPPFFWTNNIIYPERMLLIWILLSLIFFTKGITTNKTSLWYGILFMNLALYTKETTPLFYLGILLYSFVINLWNEKIKISSFIHPLKTCRSFPLETLIFFSLLIYALFYLQNVFAITDSAYMSLRRHTTTEALIFYRWELLIVFLAVVLGITDVKTGKNSFLGSGILCGCTYLALTVVIALKLLPFSNHVALKTYYLLLPATFSLIYVLYKIRKTPVFLTAVAILFICFSVKNTILFKHEEGKYYRKVTEFIIGRPQPLSIFISAHSEPRPWWNSCWLTSYKHYWPDKDISFKLASFQQYPEDKAFLDFWNNHPRLFHRAAIADTPTSGDLYVIKTTGPQYNDDMLVIKNIPHELVYQNPLFEVYKIK